VLKAGMKTSTAGYF